MKLHLNIVKFCKMRASSVLLLLLYFLKATSFETDKYQLKVTSTGPAVYGSNITFQAFLYLGTSQTPEDPNQFRYEWKSTVDGLTDTQHARFNTSLRRCYDSVIRPKKYTMGVSVFAEDPKSAFEAIATKEIDFQITRTLNGQLKFNQTVYRSFKVNNKTFSTKLPVNVTANLTDIFENVPDLTYKWYIDGKEDIAGNTPNRSLEFSETGHHSVKVEITSEGRFSDCKNIEYYNPLTGSFEADIVLKDPVSNLTMFGKKSVQEGQDVSLTAVFRGSAPYKFCWNLSSIDNLDVVLNKSCSMVNDAPILFITLPASCLPHPGRYFLSMFIENDISVLKGHQFLNMTAVPTPPPQPHTHSAATVLGPVLGVLGAITLGLFSVLCYLNYRRNRLLHIEHADFRFLSTIQTAPKQGFFSSVKDKLTSLFVSQNSEQSWQRMAGVDNSRRTTETYGSMVSLVEQTDSF